MRVILLYNQVSITDTAADLDVLKQVVNVEQALLGLNHSTSRVPCSLDMEKVRRLLRSERPDAVFNLVESLGGTDRLMPLAVILLESLSIPFTGASSLAMLSTTGKLEAKNRMVAADLPTPAWITEADSAWQGTRRGHETPDIAIVKAVAEHASLGMTDESVFSCRELSPNAILEHVVSRSRSLNTPHFAEEYIDGREFNLSILAGDDGPLVLPPAEMDFGSFPDDKPRIVGHDAKWNEHTHEYRNTPRRFEFPPGDQPLLDELQALARGCWTTFGLRGYARVDFRVNSDGQPWILEVNANPCLSSDAGFAAAVDRAGLTFEDVVNRILRDSNGLR